MAIDPNTGQHTVWVMDRGGKQRIHQLLDIDRVEWNRVRDDISTATVHITASKGSPQADALAAIEPGRHEMCIWRGDDRVWEGPITLITDKRNGVELNARDVMHYASRTIMRAEYDNSYPNITYVVQRAKNILVAELARKEALNPPINVVPYIKDYQTPTDAKTSRKTLEYQYLVFEHVDELAARSGMDYTVLGRSILMWDTSQPALGYTRTMTEADFNGETYVSVYGMELATAATVTDGQGRWGTAGGNDPYYGEVELLATAYDEEASTAPTDAELVSQAERNLYGRNPTPLMVRVPDNSSVNMEGGIKITDLVPGVYIPLRATLNIRDVSQMQKLQSVKVIETESGEDVQVVMAPSTKSDEPEGS